MKRFIAGLLLGLLFNAVAAKAEWSWGDMTVLKEIRDSLRAESQAQQQMALSLSRISGTLNSRLPQLPAERCGGR